MITVGGHAVATPALTRAIREFGEQAKKRLDDTGSLAGFEAKFSDDSNSDGSVTITISALGAAAYDAKAGKDDTILAFTLTTAQLDGGETVTSLSSGSSEIIRGDQDIDSFTARFQDSTDQIHFGAHIYGTPEELAAAGLGPLPQPGVPDAGPALAGDGKDKGAAEPTSELFAKLQQKQSASGQLIGLLQSFVDALGGRSASERSKRESDQAVSEDSTTIAATDGSAQNAIRDRLTRFAGTDVTT
ncbi:hypothetical protein [Dongia sedimenti]|uniref:Uncharacterized protein n=1 Tax=Dongia sedimenti TaxID=3064282 RepID=A0ABU0YHX9_9PROT|nr:hypothetical protein [Rhodospirillaceae bacterium R-7]